MRVGAEYQARIPDFEPGKSLFCGNLTSCRRRRSRAGGMALGLGREGSARRSPGVGRGVAFILLLSLCVGDPVSAAGGWQGQRLLSARPGARGGHLGGEFSLHYQPYYVYPAGGGGAEKGWMPFLSGGFFFNLWVFFSFFLLKL